MNPTDTQAALATGQTALGIEFGSTRIKAVLIGADLLPHFGMVELKPRGKVELYFKHRYRHFRHTLGTLTEYFAFEDVRGHLNISILREDRESLQRSFLPYRNIFQMASEALKQSARSRARM